MIAKHISNLLKKLFRIVDDDKTTTAMKLSTTPINETGKFPHISTQ